MSELRRLAESGDGACGVMGLCERRAGHEGRHTTSVDRAIDWAEDIERQHAARPPQERKMGSAAAFLRTIHPGTDAGCPTCELLTERDAAVSARQEAERVLEELVGALEKADWGGQGSLAFGGAIDKAHEAARATLARTREPAGDVKEGEGV